jgi:hypothetical protein
MAADNTLSERDKLLAIADGYRDDFDDPADRIAAAEEDLRRANAALGIG